MRVNLHCLTLLTFAGFTLLVLPPTAIADEWWERSPYYNEDEWYDPTDWLDGNNYEFDQEAYENYSAGLNDATSYDYGYDHEDDRSYTNDWFYDYYDDGYASYHDFDDDGTYDYFYRYYDYDDDGTYDAYFAYTDTNDDGIYDDFDYYSFGDVSAKDQQSSQKSQSRESKRRQVSGAIASTKRVSVRDTQHLIATVEQENGRRIVVDLGPANKLNNIDLQQGDRLSARGPAILVGDKRIMLAQQVQVNGQPAQIQRSGRQLNGTVVRVQNPSVSGEKHRLVTLETSDGRNLLVDLGPTRNLQDLEIKEGDEITVSGPMVRVQDRRVVMARQVTTDEGRHQINRRFGSKEGQQNQQQQTSRSSRERQNSQNRQASQNRQQERQASQSRQVSGEVLSKRRVTVRGTERLMTDIRTSDGSQVTIDLGPVEQLNQSDIQISQGDQITARGTPLRVEGQRVLVANELQASNQSIRIRRMQR